MKKTIKRILVGMLSLLLFVGCKKDEDTPVDHSKESIYECLTENGNYTLFLEGVNMAGFENLLKQKQAAVFIPDDEVFRNYMAKKGVSSIQGFDPDSLKLLIGYHLLDFVSNPDDYSAFGRTTEPGNSGICYKYRTFYQPQPKDVTDPKTGRTVKMYQLPKYLPVISTDLLREQGSNNYEGDYKMFFPSVNWQGDQNKLYVGNAAVIGDRIAVSNGYVLRVDEVLEPLVTVYDALAAQRPGVSFNVFRKLYDRFAYMEYNSWQARNNRESNDSLFNFYHYLPPTLGDDLPDIAYEWTGVEVETEPEAHLKFAFNCFAPTDELLTSYIKDFFGVQNIDDVPLLNLYYLLRGHCVDRRTLQLPSLVEKGVEGRSGEKWELERKNLLAFQFCSNGVFYGVDKLFEPAEFNMVTKPLFQYPRFSTLLNVGYRQGSFKELTDPEGEYTIFAVADARLKDEYGIYVDYYAHPLNPDVLNGRVDIKIWNTEKDHTIRLMTAVEERELINVQIVKGYADPEETTDMRVFYPTMQPFRFIYTQYGMTFGEDQRSIVPNTTWKYTYSNGGGKGIVYEMDDKLPVSKDYDGEILTVQKALSENYPKFYSALQSANLLGLLDGKRFMVFAPTDDVWDESKLPADAQKRANCLKYFFVPVAENNLTNYTLPEFGKTGEFETCCTNSSNAKVKMTILFENDRQLKVKNPTGAETLTDESVPYFTADGLVFGLTGMITPE